MATPVTVPRQIPVNGQLIRFRWEQMIAWSVVAGFAGACLAAGGYLLWLEVDWHIHLGSFNHGSSLKLWWDNLFRDKSWVLYRHGLRDLGEPAAATVGAKTLLAKSKWWTFRASTGQLLAITVLLAVTAVALIVGGMWLINFGLPDAWHWAFGSYRIIGPGWIAHSSWENLALGLLVIGPVLHLIWAPAGATLQGYQIDAAVDRALRTGHASWWVDFPVVPPVIRERYSWDLARQKERILRESHGVVQLGQRRRRTSRGTRVLVAALVVVGALVTIVGVIAKFWIATHHGFWYLTS